MQILDAALDLFGERGFTGTSLRDVAERAGLSHPGLLHHFASKEALLAAVLQRRDEVDRARVGSDGDDPDAMLDRLVAVVEHNAEVPGLVELYCVLSAEATASGHPAHGYFRERYQRLVGELERAGSRLRQAGRLRPGTTPHSFAVTTVAVVDGLQVQWLLSREDLDMASELRAHLAVMVTP